MTEKINFNLITRCPECNSDKIYVFQDSDGGLCLKCKYIIDGHINGGLTSVEIRRMRGLLPTEETVNDRDRKEVQVFRQPSVVVVPPVSTIEKVKSWLRVTEKKETEAVPSTPVRETTLPMIGELWNVGPCDKCRLNRKYSGPVVRSKMTNTTSHFVEINDLQVKSSWYGCFFCSKKA